MSTVVLMTHSPKHAAAALGDALRSVLPPEHAAERAANVAAWLCLTPRDELASVWRDAMDTITRPCTVPAARRFYPDATVGQIEAALRDGLLAWIEATTPYRGDAAYEELLDFGGPDRVLEGGAPDECSEGRPMTDSEIATGQPFCACGRLVSRCDGSRKGCGKHGVRRTSVVPHAGEPETVVEWSGLMAGPEMMSAGPRRSA